MTLRTAGLTAAAMMAFAANSLLCRAALGAHAVDALTFTSVRLSSGALVLALLVRGRPGARGPFTAWRLGAALFAYAIGFSLAYARITAGVGALLLFGAVQVTMIGGGLVAGERPPNREWLGLGLALAGLVGLTFPGLTAPDPAGAALMLAAGVAWGVYSLGARAGGEPLAANAASFACTVPLALVAQGVGFMTLPPKVTTAGLALAVTSGAVTSGLGYAIWYAALRGLTAAQAAIVQLSVPPLAALGAVALLGEAVGARLIVSGGAVLGGIAVAFTVRRR
ncbi:MAG: EamA family transporter [Acidobacteria bacterium]|nr:MAG: EamA family transporter [Acidobacteriota bacterium]